MELSQTYNTEIFLFVTLFKLEGKTFFIKISSSLKSVTNKKNFII